MRRRRRRRSRPRGPYKTIARFDSVCPETGEQIKKGDTIIYYPAERKAYHVDSKQAEEFRGQQFNQSWGMTDANY